MRRTEPIGEEEHEYLLANSDHLQKPRPIHVNSREWGRSSVSEPLAHRTEEYHTSYPGGHIKYERPSIPTTAVQRDPSRSGQRHLSGLDDSINNVDVASKSRYNRNTSHKSAEIVNPRRRMESSPSLPAVTPTTPITISGPIPVARTTLGDISPLIPSSQIYQNDALTPTVRPNNEHRSLTSTPRELHSVGPPTRPSVHNNSTIAQGSQPKKVRRVPPPIFEDYEDSRQQDIYREVQANSLTSSITLEHRQRLTREKPTTAAPIIMDDKRIRQAEGLTVSSIGDLRRPSTKNSLVLMVQHSCDSHPLDPVTATVTLDPGLGCQRTLEESIHRDRLVNEEVRQDLLESLQSGSFPIPSAGSGDPSRAEMAQSQRPFSARKSESRVNVPKHPNDIDFLAPPQMSSPKNILDLIQELGNPNGSRRTQGEEHTRLSMGSKSRRPPNGVIKGSNRRSLQPATEGNGDTVTPETRSLEHSPFDVRSAKALSDNMVEIKSILQGLREEGRAMHDNLTGPNNYREDLVRERERARRLEEEIQRTKDAIQAIRAEKVMVQEKKCLDTLASVSQLQVEMRHQLQDINNQMKECQATHQETNQRSTTAKSPTQARVDPTENLIYQLALGHAENRTRQAEQQSAEEAEASADGHQSTE